MRLDVAVKQAVIWWSTYRQLLSHILQIVYAVQ
jgi:hypothetical protein